MSHFLIYLIKSTVCLSIFYSFFLIAMRHTTFYRFNRGMLLIGTIICMILPCYTLTTEKVEGIKYPIEVLDEMLVLPPSEVQLPNTSIELHTKEIKMSSSHLPFVLMGIYILGITIYLVLVLKSFVEVWKFIVHYPKLRKDGCWLIIVPHKIPSFSWNNYIIISEEDYLNYPQILVHERMHYICRHSYDMLFMTLINAFHWFNPIVWFIRIELKQLHEFEADKSVINQGIDATQYQLLLVQKAVGKKLYTIANGFNHTKLKKRITMMTQENSSRWERLKWLVSIPMVMGAMLMFAQPEVKEKLETIATAIDQQSNNMQNLESLKTFFQKKCKAYEEVALTKEFNGIKATIVQESQVNYFRVNKRNQILLGDVREEEVYLDQSLIHTLRPRVAEYLRLQRNKAEKVFEKPQPQALIFVHDKESNPDSLFSYLKQIKLAFDDIRHDYPQDDKLDLVCPYWLHYVEVEQYGDFNKKNNIEISLYDKQGTLIRTFKNFSNWELYYYLDELPEGFIDYANINKSPKTPKGHIKSVTNILQKANIFNINVK